MRPEICRLLRHFDLKHFLNSQSKSYKKFNLHEDIPDRAEVLDLIADDNDLLIKPIIVSGRLMTVGFNKAKILEMLQIKSNGSDPEQNRYNIKNKTK
jgi:arsenate reductase-like glutaredoxin family protein